VLTLLLVGHGKMGKLVESLAASHDCRVAAVVTNRAQLASAPAGVDVAIDFSVPGAVVETVAELAARGISVVIGTTGWLEHEAEVRAAVERSDIGAIAAANFSLGMNIFQRVVEQSAKAFAARPDVGAWIHEAHHSAKKDAPSGTALLLKRAMTHGGYTRTIDVSSTRAGAIPGTHTVGFDGPAETVTLTHTVRDRAVFAHGALEAAKWLHGRRGWFTMSDMLGT